MSEITPADAARDELARLKIASDKSTWLDQFNETCSEWCSSILVKETRQALKSRQFIWTYVVLLICVGSWTVLGLTFGGQQYEAGRSLLIGFFYILAFPLVIIIPFSAYRSLAREFEDGTISLISITTMKPHQIVIGKFGSAILQMLIYLSVIAPCICCTYLLRGVSIDQILLGLVICVGGSIALTILGLFLAGAFRSRTLGVGVSVLFILLLGWLYVMWCVLCEEFYRYGNAMDWNEAGMMEMTFLTVSLVGSTAALLLVTAAAQISFASDNRSTSIRIAMIVQHMLFFAFVIVILSELYRDMFVLWLIFAGHYWLLMGFLMIGESSTISRRVQRTLPRTILSRSFLSLLMPGAGRGYLFAVANMCTSWVGIFAIWNHVDLLVSDKAMGRITQRWGASPVRGAWLGADEMAVGFVSTLFAVWFLSVGYLIINSISEKRKREWGPGVGPMISLVVGVLVVAFVSIGSAVIHYNLANYNVPNDPSPILALNWYWTAWDIDRNGAFYSIQTVWNLLFLAQAVVVIGIAMVIASRELLLRPIETPQRVAIDKEKKQERKSLPPGESIDEIFGEARPS